MSLLQPPEAIYPDPLAAKTAIHLHAKHVMRAAGGITIGLFAAEERG
jgi:hypothetical protein